MGSKRFYEGGICHIFNKSIAQFRIFNRNENTHHFLELLDFYNNIEWKISFSKERLLKNEYKLTNLLLPREHSIVKFISYCIMPDHFHLLVKVLHRKLMFHYLNNIGNSYTRFLNTKLDRKGPLWQSAYKMVHIKTNEQLLHVSRYIHLNPTTSQLVDKPEDWKFSSYKDFVSGSEYLDIINEISIRNHESYKKFVEDNQDYQHKLRLIKKLKID